MRYVALIFWALILGPIVGFLGASLTMSAFSLTSALWVSLFVALIVILVDWLIEPKKDSRSV